MATIAYKPKLVVYVAGPFRGKNNLLIAENIAQAHKFAWEVWRLGATAICPHRNTGIEFQGTLPDEVWLEGDLEHLKRSDAILMLPLWARSEGSVIEHKHAKAWGLHIFYELKDLEGWLREKGVEPVEHN